MTTRSDRRRADQRLTAIHASGDFGKGASVHRLPISRPQSCSCTQSHGRPDNCAAATGISATDPQDGLFVALTKDRRGDDVVAGAGLECADKLQKRCGPPIVRKSGDRLCFGGGREADESIDATRRQPVDLRQPFRDDADFVEMLQRPADLGAALDIGTVPKAIERTLAGAFRYDDESVDSPARAVRASPC